jgi:hypothetical protein
MKEGLVRSSSRRDGQQDTDLGSLVSDGFGPPDLGADIDAPPAYGEHHDQLRLSQAGFEAGAAVTGKFGTASPHASNHAIANSARR